MLSWWIVWYGEPFLYFFVLYLLVVLSCKIAEVGFGWWAAAMIGLIVITTDPPQALHYQCHMSFKSKLNLSNPSSAFTKETAFRSYYKLIKNHYLIQVQLQNLNQTSALKT